MRRHVHADWTQVNIYRDNDLFRTFYSNPEWDGAVTDMHLGLGDIEIHIYGKSHTKLITIIESPRGKIQTVVGWGWIKSQWVRINNEWWKLKKDGSAHNLLSGLNATWGGSHWVESSIE